MRKLYQSIADVIAFGYKSTRSTRIHTYKDISAYMSWYTYWLNCKHCVEELGERVRNEGKSIDEAMEKMHVNDGTILERLTRTTYGMQLKSSMDFQRLWQSQVVANTRCMMSAVALLEMYY